MCRIFIGSPLGEAVQHVKHPLPVEQGGQETAHGEDSKSKKAFQHSFKWRRKHLHHKSSPGDDEVLLPASLLGDQVDVPVEHCHQHAYLGRKLDNMGGWRFQMLKVHKTDHEANAEADKANCHAILADEALEEEGLYMFAL